MNKFLKAQSQILLTMFFPVKVFTYEIAEIDIEPLECNFIECVLKYFLKWISVVFLGSRFFLKKEGGGGRKEFPMIPLQA